MTNFTTSAANRKVLILFPHQLFELKLLPKGFSEIVLVEEFLFFKQFNFHKQKIAFHRATLKAYERELKQQKAEVSYISSFEKESDIRLLIKQLADTKAHESLMFIDPTDDWLEQRIRKSCERLNLHFEIHNSPLFLTDRAALSPFFRKDKKSFFQTSFYKNQRKELNILMDASGNPEGGKWTFDTENRKKFPKGKLPPSIHYPSADDDWIEALAYTEKQFGDNLGLLAKEPRYPISRESAEIWFDQFLTLRFHEFGDYEDAIVKDELILHHSLLSPLINVGLLSPNHVLEKSVAFAKAESVPINSLEGFVRQIIGWREFIRGMYDCKGSESRTMNFWGFDRKIPSQFYDGTTGIIPVDDTIKKVLQTGYCHHIERLMVIGNFMLLCEFDPDEVYRWFMELFIDAYDWVMVPNVYGMSQFADGGFFATKPYLSGSNYIMNMSNYPKGDWQETWDGLFWNFIDKHQDFFKKNPRTSMMVNTVNKMSPEKRTKHLENAAAFLKTLDR